MESLWVAKTGLEAQQMRMSVVSNNLANVNTTGFKRGRAIFEDLLYQNVAAGRRLDVATDGITDRLESRHRRQSRRDRQAVRARQHPKHEQPARHRDPRARILRDPDARRRSGIHARRHLPDRRRRPDGDVERLRAAAGRDDSHQRASRHDRSGRRRVGGAGRPSGSDSGGHGPARRFRESRGPAIERPKPHGGVGLERPPAARNPGLERARHRRARRARGVQRERRRGARLDDRNAARVRDELARDRDQPTRCCSISPTTCKGCDETTRHRHRRRGVAPRVQHDAARGRRSHGRHRLSARVARREPRLRIGPRDDLQPRRQLRLVHGPARARGRRHSHDQSSSSAPMRRRNRAARPRRTRASTRAYRSSRASRSRSNGRPILNAEIRSVALVRRQRRREPEQPPGRQHHGDRRRALAERQPARARRKAHQRSIKGEEYIRLQGIIRPVDIGPANSVASTKVADAKISYSGKGHLADSSSPGWLSRFFNSPWFPF